MSLVALMPKRVLPSTDKDSYMPADGPETNYGRKASPKSMSAAKRDALWLHSIAERKDAKALSDLFGIYGNSTRLKQVLRHGCIVSRATVGSIINVSMGVWM